MSGGISASTVIAGVGAAASVAGTVGGLARSGQQAGGQRQQAEDTYRAAVLRNQQLEMQAEEMKMRAEQRDNQAYIQDAQAHLQQHQAGLVWRDAEMRDTEAMLGHRAATATRERASDVQGGAQRAAIESKRKAANAAGRAKAIMGASGAGVDTRVLADILGEGDYAADVAKYEGDARARDIKTEADLLDYGADVTSYGADITRYNARVADYGVTLSLYGAEETRYQATLDRRQADSLKWWGGTELAEGARGAQALYGAADRTQGMGYATAAVNAGSIVAKYLPTFMSGGSGVTAVGGAYSQTDATAMGRGAGLYDSLRVPEEWGVA